MMRCTRRSASAQHDHRGRPPADRTHGQRRRSWFPARAASSDTVSSARSGSRARICASSGPRSTTTRPPRASATSSSWRAPTHDAGYLGVAVRDQFRPTSGRPDHSRNRGPTCTGGPKPLASWSGRHAVKALANEPRLVLLCKDKWSFFEATQQERPALRHRQRPRVRLRYARRQVRVAVPARSRESGSAPRAS